MSYKFRTLIIFDTNTLRHVSGGDVAYSIFKFGSNYDVIEEFLKKNGLKGLVTLAVSIMAVEELKNQKRTSYKKDIQKLKEIVSRLEGLPNVPQGSIKIPDEDFDCGDYVEKNTLAYVEKNNINIIELKNVHAKSALNNLVEKVVGEKPISPFAVSGTYNDAGFKDAFIWETLLHFDAVSEYDKVVLFTKDNGFKDNCYSEFSEKWNKYFKIIKDHSLVIRELEKDYSNYINEKSIYDYAESEYFRGYLNNEVKDQSEKIIDDINIVFDRFEIVDLCTSVERVPPSADEDECILINSNIWIFTKENDKPKQYRVIAKTKLTDEETKEIVETTFNYELI